MKEDELKELDNALERNEKLQAVVSGTVESMSSFKTQWLVITNKRVLLYARALIGGGSDSFSYDEISSVQGQKGILLGSVELNVKGKTEKFINMQKDDVEQSVNIIRQNIEESKSKKSKETSPDPLEQIKKLKELLDLGAITREDFENKKKKLLESI